MPSRGRRYAIYDMSPPLYATIYGVLRRRQLFSSPPTHVGIRRHADDICLRNAHAWRRYAIRFSPRFLPAETWRAARFCAERHMPPRRRQRHSFFSHAPRRAASDRFYDIRRRCPVARLRFQPAKKAGCRTDVYMPASAGEKVERFS